MWYNIPPISVNLSARQFLDKNLLGMTMQYFEQSQIDPNDFCFELTESSALQDFDYAKRVLNQLHGMGIKFYLDDFGTGCLFVDCEQQLPTQPTSIDLSYCLMIGIFIFLRNTKLA